MQRRPRPVAHREQRFGVVDQAHAVEQRRPPLADRRDGLMLCGRLTSSAR